MSLKQWSGACTVAAIALILSGTKFAQWGSCGPNPFGLFLFFVVPSLLICAIGLFVEALVRSHQRRESAD